WAKSSLDSDKSGPGSSHAAPCVQVASEFVCSFEPGIASCQFNVRSVRASPLTSRPMDIVSIGGGPAGLYFSILAKKAFPSARIRVLERNKPDDTFGWGVVFSEETLSHF